MKESRLINKMKKLLAMANDKSSENEAAIAMRQLHALLSKHNISMAEVEDNGDAEEQVDRSHELHRDRPWKRLVALNIAKLYFCDMYFTRIGGGKSNYFFVGTETNRTFALAIFDMVIKTIERESRAESRKLHGKEVSSFVNSFWTGAQVRIAQRCQELIAAAKEGSLEDGEGSNLPAMLSTYEHHSLMTKEFLSDMNMKTEKVKTRANDIHGYEKGQEAGSKVQLSRGVGQTAEAAIS